MLSIFYQKNENSKLFKTLEDNGIFNPQNYIPIYKIFFSFSDQNFNNVNLNHMYHIKDIKAESNISNCFECIIESETTQEKRNTFFKFSPLLDTTKYLIGKYTLTDEEKQALPQLKNNICHPKVLDSNNAAYVDSFFSYLSSKLLHKHEFLHGIDFFGSFLGIKKKFTINIFDDIEYLSESDFFIKNCNKLFKINNIDQDVVFGNSTRNNMKKLVIKNDDIAHVDLDNIDEIAYKKIFTENENNISDLSTNLVFECHQNTEKSSVKRSTSTSSCSFQIITYIS